MLYSKLPGKPREESAATLKSFRGYKYLMEGGYVRPAGKGLYSLLPLGKRVEENLKQLIAREMKALNGLEISVPLISPESLWEESGRLHSAQTPFGKFKDRSGRRHILSPTHEEAVTALIKGLVKDHRDLPLFVYQFQLKYRDELRPRGGLIRSKEFLMKDGYSFHRSFVELNNFFPAIFSAYTRIFQNCAVETLPVEADCGFMGGSKSYEFVMPHHKGKSVIIQCSSCEYRASQSIAQGSREFRSEELKPLESVPVKDFTTLDALSREWNRDLQRFCVSELYRCRDKLFLIVHLADDHLSSVKLQQINPQCEAQPPSREDYIHIGQEARFLSPFGLPEDVKILVDKAVVDSTNLAMASGEEGFFYQNVNFGRDFDAHTVGDLVRIKKGETCHICGGKLEEKSGIELGHIFKLDDIYSRSMQFSYQNLRGELVYPHMGSYGIGLARLMEAVAESNCDSKGLIWPYQLAPFKVFLMGTGKSPTIKDFVKELSESLGDKVLVDDRLDTVENKYRDFLLLGIPLRIVINTSFLEEGTVQFYERSTGKEWDVPGSEVLYFLESWEKEQNFGG